MISNWSWMLRVVTLAGALAFGQEKQELGLEFLEGVRLKIEIERDLDGADEDLTEGEQALLRAIDDEKLSPSHLQELERILAQTRLLMAHVRLEKGQPEAAKRVLAKIQVALLDPEAIEKHKALKSFLQHQRSAGETADNIHQLAMTKLREGDLETVQQLGTLAVPALVEWIEGRLDEFPDTVQQDPLRMLAVLSRDSAAELVGRHMESGTFLFKKRVLRVMNALLVLVNPTEYEASSGIPRTAKSPQWMRAIEIAAQEPALAAEVMPKLPHIFRNSACTPKLRDTLISALVPSDPRYRHIVRAIAEQTSFGEDARALLEKALVCRDPDLRVLAVIRWGWGRETVHPLARDADARVRSAVAKSLRRAPDSKDREVLKQLAADSDYNVLENVAKVLGDVHWDQRAPEFLPMLDAFVRNPVVRSDSDLRETAVRFAERATQHDAGSRWLVRLALATQDEELLLASTEKRDRNALYRIPLEEVGPYAKRVYEVSRDRMARLMHGVAHAQSGDLPKQADLVAKFHELAGEPGLDSGLTLFFGLCNPWQTGPEVRPLIGRALADPRWSEQAMVTHETWLEPFLQTRLKYAPGEAVNELLLPLLQDETLQDDLLRLIVKHYDARAPKGDEVVRAILDRWLEKDLNPRTEPYSTVDRALSQLGRFPFEGSDMLLRRLVKEGRYLSAVAKAMGESRDPSFVGDLAKILRDPRTRREDFAAAFLALRGFLTDETAEVLLDLAAETGAGETRDACLSTVEDIRAYQDARRRWESRKLSRATRERATAELYELLDSELEAQRIEAVRGLGTLGAIEAIPRLIRMLSDPSPALREAAQAALDRLNEMHKEEGN